MCCLCYKLSKIKRRRFGDSGQNNIGCNMRMQTLSISINLLRLENERIPSSNLKMNRVCGLIGILGCKLIYISILMTYLVRTVVRLIWFFPNLERWLVALIMKICCEPLIQEK